MIYLKLLWTFVRLGTANELAYRTHFLVQILQSLLQLGTALAGLAIIFAHTSRLGDWKPEELLALLGVYFLVGGAIDLVLEPGMQNLMNAVQQGTLDYTLVKPMDAQLLVSIQRIRIWGMIDIAQGMSVLVVALARLGNHIGIAQALLFVATLLASGMIIYSFWLVLASCSFWFVRVESMLAIFENMYQAGRWPLGVYPPWLRVLLTFIVPVGLATTIPAEELLGRLTWEALAGMSLLALVMLATSRQFWRIGLRRYSGASS